MTTEEKLKHFYDISAGEAKTEAEKLLDAHRDTLEEQFRAHTAQKDAEIQALLKSETDRASREINKALSVSQLEIKRNWSHTQNDLKERLFGEVKKLLDEFRDTPEYEEFLIKKIKEAKDFAGDDPISIRLSPQDRGRLERLAQKTGAALELSESDFMGGVQAVIPGKNILIDNSLLGAFEEERKNFTFDGGRKHE